MSTSRRAGILVPVFALRTADDLGIGDTRGVRDLIDWAASIGLRFLQFLPINATGGDNSPYNAISSVALEPLTLELTPSAVPELTKTAFKTLCTQHRVASLRGARVMYPAVRALKYALIRSAFARLKGRRLAAFKTFCTEEKTWLDDFCLFRLLMDRLGHEDWTTWPEEFNTRAKARAWLAAQDTTSTGDELAIHAYAQWLCFTQWCSVRDEARARGIGLMGDVPFGISWCSADVFFGPEQFDLTWCGGAPPETYFKDDLFVQKWGQNWGIPLYNWAAMEAANYPWWRQRVQKLTEVFDIFRIDHVLGFYRIYSFPWRPQLSAEFLPLSLEEAAARCGGRLPHFIENDDETEAGRAANLAAGDKYLRMIVEAAGSAEVIAEDLGTVPPYVRPHLLSLDIPGFKISHWEHDEAGNVVQGTAYENCAFTTYATHDHEPMKTHWEHRRRDFDSDDEADRKLGAKELRLLCQFAWLHPENGPYPAYDETVRRALIAALLKSNARLAACMLTDLFGLEERFNIPGIAGEMNWSARLPMTLEEMRNDPHWSRESDWLREAVQSSGRASHDRAP